MKKLSKVNYNQAFFRDACNPSQMWQNIFCEKRAIAFLPQYYHCDQKIDSPTDIYKDVNSFFANVGKNLTAGIKHMGKIKSH